LESHYEVLGVARSADGQIIRAAYRVLAKRYHPDVATGAKDKAAARFRSIQEAYEVLSDARQRADYDAQLEALQPTPAPPCPNQKPPPAPGSQPRPETPERKSSPQSGTYAMWLAFAVLFGLGAFFVLDAFAVVSETILRAPFIVFVVGIFVALLKLPPEKESGSVSRPEPRPPLKPKLWTTRGAALAKGVIAAIALAYWGAVGLLLILLGFVIVIEIALGI